MKRQLKRSQRCNRGYATLTELDYKKSKLANSRVAYTG